MTGCRVIAPQPAVHGLILLYHSVGSAWGVSRDAFRWQLLEVSKSYDVVPVRDLSARLAIRSHRPIACVTFDDGYLDNSEVAAPIMSDLGLAGTFFVVTAFMGQSFSNSVGSWPMMGAHQVRALAVAGHEIGAHTVTHPKLTEVGSEEMDNEVRQSKGELEDLIDAPVPSFAYPKGRWHAAVRDSVKNAGFETACTITPRHLQAKPDLLSLPRFTVLPGTTRRQFRATLSRGLALYTGLVRR